MGYQHFKLAVYCPVRDVEMISENLRKFEQYLTFLQKHLHIDKVYLETYRGGKQIDREKIENVREFFLHKGIKVSGGITPDALSNWEFKSLCYTNAKHRELLANVVKFTAELFDEIILDDFYFTNCKCPSCIEAKGDRSWTEFRLQILKEASEELVLQVARAINPTVKLIIKFPNWYDDYQTTGYNLEAEPRLFDNIYTGTETRDPRYTQQTLQRYLSYFLIRYFENVAPGRNGGGWFDTFDCSYNLGSYAEQCYLTLFAKAREVTLFCMGSLYRDQVFVPIGGYALERADRFLGDLGNPVGIACYKPYHSSGENYLHTYLGMLGLPLEPIPDFPTRDNLFLLTQSAGQDQAIVTRLKEQLLNGKTVVMTSGLLQTLTDHGMEKLADVRYTHKKAMVSRFAYPMHECSFANYVDTPEKIIIPQIEYSTNDCTPIIVAFAESRAYPILLKINYGSGTLYILTIPDNFGDLYHWPAPVLNEIRKILTQGIPVRIEGPGQIGLFAYDNQTFIVESFRPVHTDVTAVIPQHGIRLTDLETGEILEGYPEADNTRFVISLAAATFRVFRCEKLPEVEL